MKLFNHFLSIFFITSALEGRCNFEVSNCIFEPTFFMDEYQNLRVNKRHEAIFRSEKTLEVLYSNIESGGEIINVTEIAANKLLQLGYCPPLQGFLCSDKRYKLITCKH